VKRREDVAEAPLAGTGRRVIISREYQRSPDHPPEIVSPLQSEYTWFVSIAEGRRRRPTARCEIRSWTGEFDGVFPSPDGSVAAVRWFDQTEAGLVLVELGADVHQLDSSWETRATNWIEGPVWWPDSRQLVFVENPQGAGPWWAEGGSDYADDEDISPGGTFTPGSLVVLGRELLERSRIRIEVELSPGWFPADDADRGLGVPRIGPGNEVLVRVPGEGVRTISPGPA
jgi:hypothetical protein